MAKRDIHVVPHKRGWALKWEGAERASSIHPTQKQAEDAARPRARAGRVELVVHRPDGRIRDKDSHGLDPNSPKDRR